MLVRLFVAKCQDLQISATKQQILRFIENYGSVNRDERMLNLQDMGLGNFSLSVIADLISSNQYSQLDLSKNNFTDQGLMTLIDAVEKSSSLMSLILNANQITSEGAAYMFKKLNNSTLTNLELANPDCLASKIRVGNKGAIALSRYLNSPNCVLSIIDLTGS